MHLNWSVGICEGSTRHWNYYEYYWPCAGVSVVNAIGTQLRDPINYNTIIGTDGGGWWFKYMNGRRRGNREETRKLAPDLAFRFSLSMENEQADAGRDGRTRLARGSSGDRNKLFFPV